MKPIQFPLRVPKKYHRAFMLQGDGFQYLIEIEGSRIHSAILGIVPDQQRNKTLDWVAECIGMVRKEIGK